MHRRPTPTLGGFATAILGALLLACGGGGCVERTISITSEPSNALVYLNDEEVGRTPLTVPFTFYGVYDVRLERDGFHPLWTQQEAKAPWWETPGPDLIAEAVPRGESKITWHFQLAPAPAPEDTPADPIIDRARQMRTSTLQGEPRK